MKPIKHTLECAKYAKKYDSVHQLKNNQDNLYLSTSDYRQLANYSASSDGGNVYEVPLLNLSVGNLSQDSEDGVRSNFSNSSSSSSSLESAGDSSKDSSSTPNEEETIANKGANKTTELQNVDNFQMENLVNSSKCNLHRIDSKKAYSKKLVSGACELMIKFIIELNACSIGFISSDLNDQSNKFNFGDSGNAGKVNEPICNNSGFFSSGSSTEYITPSRFCRRSSTKSWDTGSGSPEAICFSVNKNSIYISGVRVYAFSMGQLKYQLQLLDQVNSEMMMADDNGRGGNVVAGKGGSGFTWRTLASVSGMLAVDDNQNNDFCELRFDRPVLISANVKVCFD